MTQQQFADKAGLDNTYISRLEKGLIVKPRIETLKKIAKALGIDVKILVERANAKRNKDGLIEDSTIRLDPDNTYLPPYLMEIAEKQRREACELDDEDSDKAIDDLIEKTMMRFFKKMLKDGDFIRSCREFLEDKLKKELLHSKAAR